jgi:hypothetical protein
MEAYFNMPIDAALESSNVLIRGLAMLDQRLGKRRLRVLASAAASHELVEQLPRLRWEAEGISIPGPAA